MQEVVTNYVHNIKNGSDNPISRSMVHIVRIRCLQEIDWEVVVTHSYREVNLKYYLNVDVFYYESYLT
jgi:hypothetical protein